MPWSEDLVAAAATVRQRVLPGLVGIGTRPPFGTGLVVAGSRVLTNSHNVRWEGRTIHFADGTRRRADSVLRDPSIDLAVVTVDTGSVESLSWAAKPPELGSLVVAAARAGGHPPRVTFGTVSMLANPDVPSGEADLQEWLEHTAPLPRGASGGPVVNLQGDLVAINTRRMGEGFYAALLTDAGLRRRVDLLLTGDQPAAGWLGVALLPPEMAARLREAVGLAERPGALVREVVPGGPADQADIRRGDLLIALGTVPLASARDLRRAILETAPGSQVRVAILRGTDEIEAMLTVGTAPPQHHGQRHHPRRGRPHFQD